MLLLLLEVVSAQDFIVTGTVNNTGTIRVKKQSAIAQTGMGGTLELKGADQSLQAKQYGSVRLSGTGVSTTVGGNFQVQNNLHIAAPVTLNITKGTVITLGDTLFESGVLNGAIQKSVDLKSGTPSSDFGRIGAFIQWNGTEPGITTVRRASDSTQFGEGNRSIRRYYEVQVSDATATGSVSFKYADAELNGHTANNLQLWRSTDNGDHWVRFIPVVDTTLKTLSLNTSVPLKGLWTAADTIRPIGPLKGGIGIPSAMANASMLDSLPIILTTLDTFKVQITDIYGTPVANVPVTFDIAVRPTPTAGGILTVTLDSTDAQGMAQTVFTLGMKVGRYQVHATSPALSDTVRLTTVAQNGAPHAWADLPRTVQTKPILTSLDSAFTVQVLDIGGNAVDSAMVRFVIDSLPSQFALDQDLSVDSIRTDSSGRATTLFTVGSKVGRYRVSAAVAGVTDSLRFYADASVGAAASMVRTDADTRVGIVGTAVTPFVVTLLDVGGNPVPNEPVRFSIGAVPVPGDSGALSATTTLTDANGSATSVLTLGTKIGTYAVSAQNATSGGTLAYTVKAEPAAPKQLAEISGNNQQRQILQTLANDFVVAVRDTFGNPVDSVMVVFRIDSVTANGTGAKLSVDSMKSDLAGLASTRLTFGSRSGLYRVTATVNGVPVLPFEANAAPGAAAAMADAAGNEQTSPILTNLVPFRLRIVDVGGNGVPNTAVTFALSGRPSGDTSAVLSSSGGVTDSLGYISSVLTLGSKVGAYRVKASATVPTLTGEVRIGRKTVRTDMASAVIETTFTATAKHGTAFQLAALLGQQQINPTESTLDTAFVVTVSDRGGNPVPNDTVRFTITEAPANASLQVVRDTVVLTDSTGTASTYLTLGTREGRYTVRADVKDVAPQFFTANAYFLYGDINKDIEINIADITSLVDILNKRSTVTASDSLKADFNRDGLIDTLDIATMRETILDRSIFTGSVQPAVFLEDDQFAAFINSMPRIPKKRSASAKTVLEATNFGLRVNLTNDEPVRGLELRMKLKDSTLALNRINMLFKRAEMMEVFVSTKAQEVRVLAYNLSNAEIKEDSGSIFRLPLITSLDMIDTTEVTIALSSNQSAPINTEKITAPPNAYPVTFRLSQNYPNPFNGATTIEYDIPDGTEFTKTVIQVFNVLGQRVKTLVAEDQQPGRYTVRWDGTDQNGNVVATGVYFYRLISKSHVGSRKMLYVK
ncbi:MAG: T9SS type A sorting domain-containing protein [Bacteroidetes bacterium]|nr:T9SS type A sorting domain-containing protein [Bacteroidota bacterium]